MAEARCSETLPGICPPHVSVLLPCVLAPFSAPWAVYLGGKLTFWGCCRLMPGSPSRDGGSFLLLATNIPGRTLTGWGCVTCSILNQCLGPARIRQVDWQGLRPRSFRQLDEGPPQGLELGALCGGARQLPPERCSLRQRCSH